MKIYVISLPDALSRQASVKQNMDALKLDYEIIKAVDGRKDGFDTASYYNKHKRLRYFGRDLMNTEIACYLSHKKAIDTFLDSEYDLALILEDDIQLRYDFPEFIQPLKDLKDTFDIVRLYGNNKIVDARRREIGLLGKDCWLVRHSSLYGGAHAYFISRKGAWKMKNFLENYKTAYPIDTLFGRSWETNVDCLAVTAPDLAMQDLTFETTIGSERFNKNTNLKGAQRLIFRVNRALFKLSENIQKTCYFLARAPQDHQIRQSIIKTQR